MHLQLIDEDPPNRTLKAYFTVPGDMHSTITAESAMMLRLIDYLQQHVAGPDVLAQTKLFSLILTNPSLHQAVRIGATQDYYRISYRMHPNDSGWYSADVLGTNADLLGAVEMILTALTRANVPTQRDEIFYLLHSPQEWITSITGDATFAQRFVASATQRQRFPIQRISAQQSESFSAYFQDPRHNVVRGGAERAQLLLTLLEKLEERDFGVPVWAYTTEKNPIETYLILTNRDAMISGVQIGAGWNGYRIRYPLQSELAPWPDARVGGYTSEIADASQMIAIAFYRLFGRG